MHKDDWRLGHVFEDTELRPEPSNIELRRAAESASGGHFCRTSAPLHAGRSRVGFNDLITQQPFASRYACASWPAAHSVPSSQGSPRGPVTVESVGNWYWIADEIEAAGCRSLLTNPAEYRARFPDAIGVLAERLEIPYQNERKRL